MYTTEGLAYLMNAAMGVSVGGAPTPKTEWYIGLTTANRSWTAADVASTIHTVGSEFETYTQSARVAWDPQALAASGALYLDDTGFEADFTMGDLSGVGGSVTIYGMFLISASAKDGTSDATATLIAGKNFATPQVMTTGSTLSVGEKLTPADDGV